MNDFSAQFQELIEHRFSVRAFSQKKIDNEIIDKILNAGRVAPTARNLQPHRILVINSREGLEKLKRCTGSHYNCVLALLVCYDKTACWVREFDQKSSGEIDAAIVSTHMMLSAASCGIGSTWVMNFDPKALHQEFALPQHLEAVSILVMGYTAENACPSSRHTERKELTETVFWNQFEE